MQRSVCLLIRQECWREEPPTATIRTLSHRCIVQPSLLEFFAFTWILYFSFEVGSGIAAAFFYLLPRRLRNKNTRAPTAATEHQFKVRR